MIINYWKQIAFVALLALSAYSGHWVTDKSWQSDWDAHMLADAQANENAAKQALAKQQTLIKELDNAYKIANDLQKKHDSNIADARAASDRLRAELDRIKALPAITHTSTIAERANAATDRRVFAELFGVSEHLAGRYAESAERHKLALSACISEYEAVRRSVGEAR